MLDMNKLKLITETPQDLPWYKNGLKFKCTECGKCCTGPTGHVWVNEQEMADLAQVLKISVVDLKRKYTRQRDNRYALTETKTLNGDYDCVFLKDNKCSVYQARPQQCRTFPWWPENLTSEDSWEQLGFECEGVNDQAPLVPYQEIVQNTLKRSI